MKKQRSKRLYLDGDTLGVVVDKLQNAIENYGSDAYLAINIDEDYAELCIVYSTEETQEEKDKRELRENVIASTQLERRRKEYENLKKEFE